MSKCFKNHSRSLRPPFLLANFFPIPSSLASDFRISYEFPGPRSLFPNFFQDSWATFQSFIILSKFLKPCFLILNSFWVLQASSLVHKLLPSFWGLVSYFQIFMRPSGLVSHSEILSQVSVLVSWFFPSFLGYISKLCNFFQVSHTLFLILGFFWAPSGFVPHSFIFSNRLRPPFLFPHFFQVSQASLRETSIFRVPQVPLMEFLEFRTSSYESDLEIFSKAYVTSSRGGPSPESTPPAIFWFKYLVITPWKREKSEKERREGKRKKKEEKKIP
jgi:hypothetical protein